MRKRHDSEYYSFYEVYQDWHRETPGSDREKEMRQAFEAWLLRLGIERYAFKTQLDNYELNESGKKLVRDYLTHNTERFYKDMRQGKFSPANIQKYEEILSLVISNMQARKLPQEVIDAQISGFWFAITENAENPGDYLSGLLRIYTSDELRELFTSSSFPLIEIFAFLNEKINKDFEEFQKIWKERIGYILHQRQVEYEVSEAFSQRYQHEIDAVLAQLPEYPDALEADRKIGENGSYLKADKDFYKVAKSTLTESKIKRIARIMPQDVKIPSISSPRKLYEDAVRVLHRRNLSSTRRMRRKAGRRQRLEN